MKKILMAVAVATAGLASTVAEAGNQLATALGGFDTVAYFTEGKAVPGRAKYHHFWNGAVWYFSSEENRNQFAATPTSFAPQYDGYCAWAASQNYKRPGDPQVWQIVDGKLYVKVHEGAQEKWRADIPNHITQGDDNWTRIAPY